MKKLTWLLLPLLLLSACSGHTEHPAPSAPETPSEVIVYEPPKEETPPETPGSVVVYDPTKPPEPAPEPEPQPGPEPEPKPLSLPEQILAGMSAEEKVGQLFLVRCPAAGQAELISVYHPGGYILFASDFEKNTPAQMRTVIASYQASSRVPMLIAADEEGGTVTRISRYAQYRPEKFLSPRDAYAAGGWEYVTAEAAEKASLLTSLGVNVNVAPVCDVARSESDFIYARSFGTDAEAVSQYVTAVVETANAGRLGSVLKHFPGYGDNRDTHTGSAYDERPRETFETVDLLPFKAGIDAGAGAVMVSHNTIACMDAEHPASLSPTVHNWLRAMGFDGVIVTDDLVMQAITDTIGPEQAAVDAILCGNDLICCTDYASQIPAVLNAVKSGVISEARLNESVLRILEWKNALGIL